MTPQEAGRVTAANLRRLAQFFRDNRDKIELEMATYFTGEDECTAYVSDGENVTRRWCGTSACALGWSTAHPEMPVKPGHFEEDEDKDLGVDGRSFSVQEYQDEYYPYFSSTLHHKTFPKPAENGDKFRWRAQSLWSCIFGSELTNDVDDAVARMEAVADFCEEDKLAESFGNNLQYFLHGKELDASIEAGLYAGHWQDAWQS